MTTSIQSRQHLQPEIQTVQDARVVENLLRGSWDGAMEIASWETLKGIAKRGAAVAGGCIAGAAVGGFAAGPPGAVAGCKVGVDVVATALLVEFGLNLAQLIGSGARDLSQIIVAEGAAKDAAAYAFGREATSLAAMLFVRRLGKRAEGSPQSLQVKGSNGKLIDFERVAVLADGTEVWGVPKGGLKPTVTPSTAVPIVANPKPAVRPTHPALAAIPTAARPPLRYPEPHDDPKTQAKALDEERARQQAARNRAKHGASSADLTEPLSSELKEIFATGTKGGEVQLSTTLSASSSPLTLLRELNRLQDNSALGAVEQNLSNGKYGPKELAFLDAVFAARSVNEVSREIGGWNPDAASLLVRAFTGDVKAQAILLSRLDLLKAMDREKENLFKRRRTGEHVEPLRPEELVVTHSTRFVPIIGTDGTALVRTSFDATGEKHGLSTVHNALNDRVTPHAFSWEGAPVTVVSRFTDMVKANGVPSVLMGVDTFWSRNPGEPLAYPDPILVLPTKEPLSEPYIVKGKQIFYRHSGLTMDDYQRSDEMGRGRRNPFAGVYSLITDLFIREDPALLSHPLPDTDWNKKLVNDKLFRNLDRALDAFNRVGGETTVLEASKRLFRSLDIESAIIGPDTEAVLNRAASRFAASLEQRITGIYQRFAVREAVEKLGGKVQPGSDSSWEDYEMEQRLRALAESYGREATPHLYSSWGAYPSSGISLTKEHRLDQRTRRVGLLREDRRE